MKIASNGYTSERWKNCGGDVILTPAFRPRELRQLVGTGLFVVGEFRIKHAFTLKDLHIQGWVS